MTDARKTIAGLLLGLAIGIVLTAVFFKPATDKHSPDSRLPKERQADRTGKPEK